MKRLARTLGLLLALLTLVLPAQADKAKGLFNKGRDAEARQNYDEAYENYRQAFELKPKDVKYRMSYVRGRFMAASQHIHKGVQLREAGQLQEALAEFQRAAEIDPSVTAAQQEIRRTRDLMSAQQAGPRSAVQSPTSGLAKMVEGAGGPVDLKPISTQPITLKMTEDTKIIYSTVGKLAGLNVLFDPDYVSRRISIELNNVSLFQALEIVALQSKTFWRPVTPNTVFIAADNRAKRTELEQSVIKTFYLSNISAPTDLQDIVNTLRTLLEVSRLQQLPSQGAIVVRGTPDQIALAEKIISDIDKAKPEVVVEVAVMQVRRDKLRDLGIQPPTNFAIQLQPNVTTSTTNNTTTPATTTSNSISLNKLANLNANDFQVTIPQATASFLFNDSTTKIIQNPQIRAVDGQKASLKIGDRVPVATGSFQPGIGGVGINPLVNTQFQYIDVGVNIDITPRVHATREITLKVMLDISSVTQRVNIGGIDQPVIGQRKVEHEIRLREGEVNLLGGILEEQDVKSLSGFPFLAQVPILKYLFSQTHTERVENEIVFALIPHIVRSQEVTDLNLRPIDVGTANAIDLRHGSNDSAAGPAPAPVPQRQPAPPASQAAPLQPVPVQQAANVPPQQPGMQAASNLGAGSAVLSFDPPQATQTVGSTFAVNIVMSGAENVYSVPLQITYDPKVLQLVNVSNGGLLSKDGQAVALVHRDDAATGTLQVTATRPPSAGGISGQGAVFTLTFLAKSTGQVTLGIPGVGARNPQMQAIPVSGAQAMVTVK